MMKRLQEIFKIHPGEGHLAALVLAYAILFFSSNVLALTASMGLFFAAYDAATLPYTYVLLMFVGPLASLIYLRLNNRFSLATALLSMHAILLLSLLLLPPLLHASNAPLLRFFLPVYLELNTVLTYTSFWNLLGRLYNLRQGKRLFPLLSSGEHLATIGASFIATLFVTRLDTVNLYWLSAIFMAGAILLLLLISRANSGKMQQLPSGDVERARPTGVLTLLKEPYVRLIFTIVTLYTISIFMVENLSYAQAEIRFPTAEGMATYVALFMGIYGGLGLLVQWLIAGRLLDRFGVNAVLLSLPGSLLLLMFIFALLGTFNGAAATFFWLAAGANMAAYLLDAPYVSARNVVLLPLPAQLRTQTQTTALGIAYPLATGLSGLLLLLLFNVFNFDSVQLSYAILLVLGLWLAAVLRLGRAYARRLRQALQERSLGGMSPFQSTDQQSISILTEALDYPQPAAVLYALDQLAKTAPERLPAHLPDLLNYPHDEVRIAALAQISRLSWPVVPAGVITLLADGATPQVRAAALQSWYAIAPQQASASLAEFAQDPQMPLRQAALVLMCRHEEPALRHQAAAALNDLVNSAETEHRIAGAAVVGAAGGGADSATLHQKLLADPDPQVRRAALSAAAQSPLPATWPALVPFLAADSTRFLAADALVAAGTGVLPLLQTTAQEPEQEAPIVAGIAFVCGQMGGPEAITFLQKLLDHADPQVRHQALLGLSRNAYQPAPAQSQIIREQFRVQAAALAQIVAAQVDVSAGQALRLTVDALEQQRRLQTDNLLLLLSFLFEPQTVLTARDALQPGQFDDEKRAYALEALDILLDRAHKRMLFPFLGSKEPQQRLEEIPEELPQTLLGRPQRLHAFLAAEGPGSDRWTRICAIDALALLPDAQAGQAIIATAVREAADPVLVETALNSLAQLGISAQGISASHPVLATAALSWPARDPLTMTLLQKIATLKQVSLFADLSFDALATIACLMPIITSKVGETVIQEGDQGTCLYVVVDGQLRVHAGERSVAFLAPGDEVGEMALLDAEPRSASVTAVTTSRLLQLDQEPFYELLAANPQVTQALLRTLSQRLRERSRDLSPHAQPDTPQTDLSPGSSRIGFRHHLAIQEELPVLNKLFILKGMDTFSRISNDLLAQVALLLQEVDLAGGETLFRQGDPGHSLYIVAEGQLRIHSAQRTLAYANAGEVIGEMALLEGDPRSASVTAIRPTLLLRLDQQPFFELLAAQPDLGHGMIKMLSHRLRLVLQDLAVQQDK